MEQYDRRRAIHALLRTLGITTGYKGFACISYALELCMESPDRLELVTKWVYLDVARHFRTSWMAVERNIRTACEVIWREHRMLLSELADRPLRRRPQNSELLHILTSTLLAREPAPSPSPEPPEESYETVPNSVWIRSSGLWVISNGRWVQCQGKLQS